MNSLNLRCVITSMLDFAIYSMEILFMNLVTPNLEVPALKFIEVIIKMSDFDIFLREIVFRYFHMDFGPTIIINIKFTVYY